MLLELPILKIQRPKYSVSRDQYSAPATSTQMSAEEVAYL